MSRKLFMTQHAENLCLDDNASEGCGMMAWAPKSTDRVTTLNDFPDELLRLCFARLPLRCIPIIRAVSKRWFGLADARQLYQLRRSLGLTESSTYILSSKYEQGCYAGLQGCASDLGFRRPIALLTGPQRLQFAAVAGGDGLLYILGGRSPLISRKSDAWVVFRRVDVYDPVCNRWYQVKPMKIARYAFAAGSFINDKNNEPRLVVAGGYDACGLAMPTAEVYDPVKDEWEAIPSMRKIRGACKGQVFRGKFYVKMANNGPDAIEVYDLSLSFWTSSPETTHFSSDEAFSGAIILDL